MYELWWCAFYAFWKKFLRTWKPKKGSNKIPIARYVFDALPKFRLTMWFLPNNWSAPLTITCAKLLQQCTNRHYYLVKRYNSVNSFSQWLMLNWTNRQKKSIATNKAQFCIRILSLFPLSRLNVACVFNSHIKSQPSPASFNFLTHTFPSMDSHIRFYHNDDDGFLGHL